MGPNPTTNSTAHTHTPTSGIESIIHITSSQTMALFVHVYVFIKLAFDVPSLNWLPVMTRYEDVSC